MADPAPSHKDSAAWQAVKGKKGFNGVKAESNDSAIGTNVRHGSNQADYLTARVARDAPTCNDNPCAPDRTAGLCGWPTTTIIVVTAGGDPEAVGQPVS